MARFNFRLNSVLNYRKTLRQQAQRNLADAYQQQQQANEELQAAQLEIDQLVNQMRDSAKQKQLDLDFALGGQRHHAKLKADMKKVADKLEQAGTEVERCRQDLIEADRDVKALEKLHDRQLADHRQQTAKHEAAEIDDIIHTRQVQPRD